MASAVFVMALIGALLGGPFMYGFNTAIINTPADSIKVFCVEAYMTRRDQDFNKFFTFVKLFGRFPPMRPGSAANLTSSNTATALGNRTSNLNVSVTSRPLTDAEAQYYISSNLADLPQGAMLTTFWSITVAVYVVGGMIGAFLSGTIADRVGRRNGILVDLVFAVIGTVCESLAKFLMIPELLPAGRAFVGIGCGIGVALGAMYLTEISPRRYRGKVGTSVQLGIVLGILVAQIVGLDVIFGNRELWAYCFISSGVPIIISIVLLPCCPESPRFLSISKMNDEAARKAIARLRGATNAEAELGELLSERNDLEKSGRGNANVSVWKLLTKRQYVLPTFLAIWLYVVQQWSGINAIFAYSETMFKSVEIPSAYIQYAVLSTGIAQILCIFFSIACSERIGRRRVMIYPTLIMSILMILFTVMVILKNISPVVKYASLLIFLLYIAAYNLGCGTVPAFFVNEVFKQNSRGSAMTIAQISHWLNSAFVVYTFPYLMTALKEYTYLLYAGILLLSSIIFIIYMPETSGLSVNLLARMLSMGFKVPIFLVQKTLTAEIKLDRQRGSRHEDGDEALMMGDTSRIMKRDSGYS